MSPEILASFDSISNLAVTRLYESPVLAITRYRCMIADLGESAEQAQPGHVIAFPHAGAFEMRTGKGWVVIDPNVVLLHNAWVPYTTRHPLGGHDNGAALALRPDLLLEVAQRHDPAVADHPALPFLVNSLPLPSRVVLLERMLVRYLTRHAGADPLAVEETALHLVDAALAIPYISGFGQARCEHERGAKRADLVEAAKAILAGQFRTRTSLSQLASKLAVSPFHLCRSFKEHTGVTIHRYIMRLRLREALERLDESPSGLTELAIDLGFDSHSHFTAAFHREYGVTPKEIRRATITHDTLRRFAAEVQRGCWQADAGLSPPSLSRRRRGGGFL
jgi:AraC family transcriptional regulator